MLFARWIDLGAPIDSPDPIKAAFGWFADDLRPTLAVSSPDRGRSPEPLSLIRIGAYDYYSGLDRSSLSVTADFEINGRASGAELFDLFVEAEDHVWTLIVNPTIMDLQRGLLVVQAKDTRGNVTTVERTFSIGNAMMPTDMLAKDDQSLTNGKFEFELRCEPQSQYLIETTQNMIDWAPWLTIQDFDGVQKLMDNDVADETQRFYRATLLPSQP
jgi:hypothetical protein